ncbi:MAG: dihydrolipoamide dehydrogenase, partial [Clostridia bacterium]|nr:dihydrolipoamide dehydrogenase [Clostridia bacterium]
LSKKTDLVVIGGGPAGYVAAITAAQRQLKVILVEEGDLGGSCLNVGCIPTKTLAKTAALYATVKDLGNFGLKTNPPVLDWAALQRRKERIIKTLRQGLARLLRSNGVEVVAGRASLISPRVVQVQPGTGAAYQIQADKIIIATGSDASRVPGWEVDEKVILTNTGILSCPGLPSSLIIVGGGVIGLEFASIFQNLGSRVTVIEILPRLLSGLDGQMVSLLQRELVKLGVNFLLNCRVSALKKGDQGVEVTCQQGEEKLHLVADKVLLALGRVPRTAGLGLKELGLALDGRGIEVNPFMETSIPGIYAAGDVTGGYQLAHVAFMEGTVAALNAAGERRAMDYRAVPMCVYTHPELAQVGLSEEELQAEQRNYKSGTFPLAANGKALIEGEKTGLVKVIQDGTYGEILGISILGSQATELIAGATLAIQNELTLDGVIATIHAHPTVAEVIREAALAAAGQPLHQAPT